MSIKRKPVQVKFTSNNFTPISVYINEKPVNIEKSEKYLGIHLDLKLNYTQRLTAKSNEITFLKKLVNLYY